MYEDLIYAVDRFAQMISTDPNLDLQVMLYLYQKPFQQNGGRAKRIKLSNR
jgi:hypothetical protein